MRKTYLYQIRIQSLVGNQRYAIWADKLKTNQYERYVHHHQS